MVKEVEACYLRHVANPFPGSRAAFHFDFQRRGILFSVSDPVSMEKTNNSRLHSPDFSVRNSLNNCHAFKHADVSLSPAKVERAALTGEWSP